MLKQTPNFRLAVICIAAASVGLSMVIISIAKLLLLLGGLAALLVASRRPDARGATRDALTPAVVLAALAALTLSLAWTVAPPADAFGSLAKYGKLLSLVLMMALIRTRREALWALGAFLAAQVFLLLGSWMLFLKLPVPWATSNMAHTEYAVFSSYLDQGIMTAVLAAVCWHFRNLAPGRFGKPIAIILAVTAISNVLFVLGGRSGHVVAIALLSFAIMWELPKKYWAAVVVLPFVLALGLYAGSGKVRERFNLVISDVHSYSDHSQVKTSSGIRLGLWRRTGQMIAEHPLAGAGVGSWSTEYNRLERADNPAHQDIEGNGNPHQEYLLWGAQLGVPGLLLFAGLLLAALRDSLRMDKPYAQAVQSVLVALAVASLFNASLYDALIGDFFCVALGLLLALGLHSPGPRTQAFAPT